mmetsp:Transcript_4875/g.16315  ORF Transcript_4875/g.16315 Transcript_4875/m.16315 type:complete len:330 (-) Transcript_4875:325-1314(-)
MMKMISSWHCLMCSLNGRAKSSMSRSAPWPLHVSPSTRNFSSRRRRADSQPPPRSRITTFTTEDDFLITTEPSDLEREMSVTKPSFSMPAARSLERKLPSFFLPVASVDCTGSTPLGVTSEVLSMLALRVETLTPSLARVPPLPSTPDWPETDLMMFRRSIRIPSCARYRPPERAPPTGAAWLERTSRGGGVYEGAAWIARTTSHQSGLRESKAFQDMSCTETSVAIALSTRARAVSCALKPWVSTLGVMPTAAVLLALARAPEAAGVVRMKRSSTSAMSDVGVLLQILTPVPEMRMRWLITSPILHVRCHEQRAHWYVLVPLSFTATM